MVRAAAFAAAWAAITAIQLYYSMNLQPSAGASTTTTASAQASASPGDLEIIFLALVAAGGLYAAVAPVYRHLHQAEAEAEAAPGGGGNRRLSDLVTFILLAAAGVLDYVLFVVDGDVGAQARALGRVAARVVPAASIGTFFMGMALMILAHVRAGSEGGGGGAVAGDQAPLWLLFLTKMAFVAAAGLVCLVAMALYAYAKY